MLGLDIYRYQDISNWRAVKNHGVRYVWRKLTDGGGQAISPGDGQVRGAQSVGIPVGGYHYAQFSPTPERQADIFIAECRRLGALDLVPMLDMEAPFSPNSQARDFSERFCRRVRALGYRPGVYMNDSFARALRPDQWGSDPVIWIARYGSKPAYGGRYDVHQYTSSGRVPGIGGNVDLNWAYSNNHFITGGGGAAPGQPEEDDMTPEQNRKLNEVWELWRKGNQTKGYPQTVGEGTGYVVEMLRRSRANAGELAGLRAAVGKLADAVANGGGASAAELKQAVAEAIQENIVQVDVTVGTEGDVA